MPKVNSRATSTSSVEANGHDLLNGFQPTYPQISYEGGVIQPCDAPGFRYRGGKYQLRRFIVRFCKMSGKVFGEPYAGRGNVTLLMRLLANYQEWKLNDISTTDFLQAIKDYDGRKLPLITNKDIGGERGYEQRGYQRYLKQFKGAKRAEMEYMLLLLESVLFWSGGRMGTSTPSANSYDPEKHRDTLLRAKVVLDGVELSEMDASEFIEEHGRDEENYLYVDPPYLSADVGVYRDRVEERSRMIKALQGAKCLWLLSEYRCDDLDDAFGPAKATIIHFADVGSTTNEKRVTTECLYANHPIKPLQVDFGDSPTVLPQCKKLLKEAGGRIKFEDWCRITPWSWKERVKEEQFKRLSRQPYVFFNGEEMQLIEAV